MLSSTGLSVAGCNNRQQTEPTVVGSVAHFYLLQTDLAQMRKWKPRVRIQFSVRLMLVALTACAIAFALVSRQESKRRELIATIEKAGGSVILDDPESSFWPLTSVESITVPHSAFEHIEPIEVETLIQPKQMTVTGYAMQVQKNSLRGWVFVDLQYKTATEGKLTTLFGIELGDLKPKPSKN